MLVVDLVRPFVIKTKQKLSRNQGGSHHDNVLAEKMATIATYLCFFKVQDLLYVVLLLTITVKLFSQIICRLFQCERSEVREGLEFSLLAFNRV